MTIYAQINGSQTAYETAGNGPPLLLIHGAEGGRAMFKLIVPDLVKHFGVIIYDQRECGDTRNGPPASSLEQLALDAAQLIVSLKLGSAFVFGTSFGGRIAQLLAILRPDLVRGLILGSTWPLPQSLRTLSPNIVRLAELKSRLPATADEIAEFFLPESYLNENPVAKEMLTNMASDPERAVRRRFALEDPCTRTASEITVPVLLVAGELDRLVPSKVTLGMSQLIKGSRTALLEGVGHATSIQAPATLAKKIRDFAGICDG